MMVVAIHTTPSGIGQFDSVTDIALVTFRQLLNCAVPIFLAISGFFIARKDLTQRGDLTAFWKKQIPRVYIPCIVFSIGWFLIDLAVRKANPLMSLLNLVVCGYSIYYFIALIIQFYLLMPLLNKFNKMGGVISGLVISLISIGIMSYMMHIEGMKFPLIVYAGPFFLWIVFFMMGVWFSNHSRSYSLTPAILLTIVGLVLSVIETRFYSQLGSGGGMGIKISSFIYSVGVIMLLFSERIERTFTNNRITAAIAWTGEISFGIYLCHMYVRVALSYLLPDSHWALSWAVTLALTIAVIVVCKRILPQKVNRRYLGF